MTFKEFFEQLELDGAFEQFAWILDAPQETFDATKDDLLKTLREQYSTETLMNEVSDSDYDIAEIKEQTTEAYIIFKEAFDEGGIELPKDRCDFFLEILKIISDVAEDMPERKIVNVTIEKCHEDAVIPIYAHNTDAGADVCAVEDVEIPGNTTVIVKTGLKTAIPNGWEIQIRPRSGMSLKTPIRIANTPGTIDAEYRDEIGIICHNTSPYPYSIKKGDRIAQMVISSVPMINFIEGSVNEIGDNRGGGFGSTGLKVVK